jgi:hypothetical protein
MRIEENFFFSSVGEVVGSFECRDGFRGNESFVGEKREGWSCDLALGYLIESKDIHIKCLMH